MDDGVKVDINGATFYFVPAVCKNATVSLERDGCFLGVSMNIEGDGWGTGGPGICLDTYDKELGRRVGTAYGAEFIRNVLERMGVDSYRDINNRPVDILYATPNPWGETWKGFRCRKMHGGDGKWMVFADVIDPTTGMPVGR